MLFRKEIVICNVEKIRFLMRPSGTLFTFTKIIVFLKNGGGKIIKVGESVGSWDPMDFMSKKLRSSRSSCAKSTENKSVSNINSENEHLNKHCSFILYIGGLIKLDEI